MVTATVDASVMLEYLTKLAGGLVSAETIRTVDIVYTDDSTESDTVIPTQGSGVVTYETSMSVPLFQTIKTVDLCYLDGATHESVMSIGAVDQDGNSTLKIILSIT